MPFCGAPLPDVPRVAMREELVASRAERDAHRAVQAGLRLVEATRASLLPIKK